MLKSFSRMDQDVPGHLASFILHLSDFKAAQSGIRFPGVHTFSGVRKPFSILANCSALPHTVKQLQRCREDCLQTTPIDKSGLFQYV